MTKIKLLEKLVKLAGESNKDIKARYRGFICCLQHHDQLKKYHEIILHTLSFSQHVNDNFL